MLNIILVVPMFILHYCVAAFRNNNQIISSSSTVDFRPNVIPPKTIEHLNITSLYGRYYQIYVSLIPKMTFEKDLTCITVDFIPELIETMENNVDIVEKIFEKKSLVVIYSGM